VADQEIGLDPNGHDKGMTGRVGYWEVKDINKSLRSLLEAGAQPQQGVTDVGGGRPIALIKDVDGNMIGLSQSP
jgi:predicted enzyme related to lactoylglutathione lyase